MTPDDQVAELKRELKQAEARAAAVHDVIQTVARSTFDLDTVLQTVIDRAVLLCHADSGNIARRVGEVYRMAAFTSFGAEYERMVRDHVYEPGRGSVVGRTVLERGVVHIIDVLEDPDYAMTDLQRAGGFRTGLGVPMLKDGEPLGVIAVGRNEVKPFSEAEIRLLHTFADQIVVAIENVRLFQTVERPRIQLARFAPQVAREAGSFHRKRKGSHGHSGRTSCRGGLGHHLGTRVITRAHLDDRRIRRRHPPLAGWEAVRYRGRGRRV